MIIGILEPKDFSPQALGWLEGLGQVRLKSGETGAQFFEGLEVLFVRLGTYIGQEILERIPSLRYLCSPTTGANHVDLSLLEQLGVEYISLKGETDFLATIHATPEHSFGLSLSLLRNYKRLFSEPHHGWNRDAYRGDEIFQKRIGIIGLGRVGKCLAGYFNAFGARVGFYDVKETIEPPDSVRQYSSLEELIDDSEMVLLCASYLEGQQPILQDSHLTKLSGKYLINTARGELIEEKSMYNLASEGVFAGLGLDVLASETLPENRIALWADLAAERPDIILTPHVAGATLTSMQRTEEFIVQKLIKNLEMVE